MPLGPDLSGSGAAMMQQPCLPRRAAVEASTWVRPPPWTTRSTRRSGARPAFDGGALAAVDRWEAPLRRVGAFATAVGTLLSTGARFWSARPADRRALPVG